MRLLLAPKGNDQASSSTCLPLGGSGRARSIRSSVPFTVYSSAEAGTAARAGAPGLALVAGWAGSPTLSRRSDTSAPLVPKRGSWPNTRYPRLSLLNRFCSRWSQT